MYGTPFGLVDRFHHVIFKAATHYVSPVDQPGPKLSEQQILTKVDENSAFPVDARSKALPCGLSLVAIAGSNSAGGEINDSYECCVLSGTSLCVGLITPPEVFCLV